MRNMLYDYYDNYVDFVKFMKRKDIKIKKIYIAVDGGWTYRHVFYKERLLWKLFKRKGKDDKNS